MNKSSVKAVFNRRNKLNEKGLAPIHIEIYRGGKNPLRKFLHTNIEIRPSEWDNQKSIVSPKHPNNFHINKVIRDAIAKIEDYEYTLNSKGQTLTSALLDDFLIDQDKGSDSFFDFFKKEIDPTLKRGTRKEHQYTLNILIEFRKQILFDEINLSLIQEFDRFMRNKGLKQNTIHKHHQHINRFIKLATLKGKLLDNKNPYAYFKSTKEKSDRINLSSDEMKKFEKLKIDSSFPELQLAKDMFLFSCYTGLRFSDVQTLEKKHLVKSIDGISIYKKMEKVPKPVTLPLDLLFSGKPKLIINKYVSQNPNSSLIFPKISNQHVNRQLKILASLTKISMRLTFHISRHTFGSMMADISQNPYLIMDLMGHSDIKTSMIYIHRSQERINKQLRNLDWNH